MTPAPTQFLDPGYRVEIDSIDESDWCCLVQGFADANLFQTWSYAAVTSGPQNVSRLVLKKGGDVVAVAQARIAKLPFLPAGIAYLRWGPLWRLSGAPPDLNTLRQAMRALRDEFVDKRGLSLRLVPLLFDDDSPEIPAILKDEGFASTTPPHERARTILMDLKPPLDQIRNGMKRNWRRNLKAAEQNVWELTEGTGDDLFVGVLDIYREMVGRKRFSASFDYVEQLRAIQTQLPEPLQMKIMLCRSRGIPCAGLVWSAIGTMGLELIAATSEHGLETKSSYLLRWKLIQRLREHGCSVHNLNGINASRNPGGYKFKRELAGDYGREVSYLGPFDAHGSAFTHAAVATGDVVRKWQASLASANVAAALLPRRVQ